MTDVELRLTADVDQATKNVGGFRKEYADLVKTLEKPLRQVNAFRELESSLEGTQREARSARERVRDLGNEMARTTNPSKDLTASYRDAVNELRRLERAEATAQGRLAGRRRELQAAGVDTRNLAIEQQRLTRELEAAQAGGRNEQAAAGTGLWTSSRSTVSTLTLTYALDGVALHSYEFSVTETISESLEYRQGATGGTEKFKAVDVLSVFTPGGTYSLSKAEVDPNASIGGGFWNPWFDFSMPGQPGQTPSRISQSPFWFDQNNVPGRLDINPVRHSNLVFGLLLWELPNNDQLANYRVIYDPVVVTPAGAVTLPAIEIDQGNKTYVFEHHAYASHCPVTGQTARDSEPVCYV